MWVSSMAVCKFSAEDTKPLYSGLGYIPRNDVVTGRHQAGNKIENSL